MIIIVSNGNIGYAIQIIEQRIAKFCCATSSTDAFAIVLMTFGGNLKAGSIRNLGSSIIVAEEFVTYTALPVFFFTSFYTCSIFLRMTSECVLI